MLATVSSPEASHVLTAASMWLLKVVCHEGRDVSGRKPHREYACAHRILFSIPCLSPSLCPVRVHCGLCATLGACRPLLKLRHWKCLEEFCGILLQKSELCCVAHW